MAEKINKPEAENHALKIEVKKKRPAVTQPAPTQFFIGGKSFEFADFVGITADTIKKRLAKAGVNVNTAWAKSFHERINKKGK